jgi:anti-anti-sigma factor
MILVPEGRLDANAAPELEDAFSALEAHGVKRVVVSFGKSKYISSSCLRVLIVHARRLREHGGDVKLCCMPESVAKVFEIAGLGAIFEIVPTEEDAARAFAAAAKDARPST